MSKFDIGDEVYFLSAAPGGACEINKAKILSIVFFSDTTETYDVNFDMLKSAGSFHSEINSIDHNGYAEECIISSANCISCSCFLEGKYLHKTLETATEKAKAIKRKWTEEYNKQKEGKK